MGWVGLGGESGKPQSLGLLPAGKRTLFLRAVQEDGLRELGCQGQDRSTNTDSRLGLSCLRVTGDVDGALKRLPGPLL